MEPNSASDSQHSLRHSPKFISRNSGGPSIPHRSLRDHQNSHTRTFSRYTRVVSSRSGIYGQQGFYMHSQPTNHRSANLPSLSTASRPSYSYCMVPVYYVPRKIRSKECQTCRASKLKQCTFHQAELIPDDKEIKVLHKPSITKLNSGDTNSESGIAEASSTQVELCHGPERLHRVIETIRQRLVDAIQVIDNLKKEKKVETVGIQCCLYTEEEFSIKNRPFNHVAKLEAVLRETYLSFSNRM